MFKGTYGTLTSHKTMIQDEYRTVSYIKAVRQAVKDNDTVIDFGSGSGVLAIAAARSGAKKVYAIEKNITTGHWLKHNILKNNLKDKIEVVIGDADNFIHNFKNIDIDVIISECIGDHLFENKLTTDYLKICDYYQVEKKIPYYFNLSYYPILIKPKEHVLKKTIDLLRNDEIYLDFDSDILLDQILDKSYFQNFEDSFDPYFYLPKKALKNKKEILFSFGNLSDIKKYIKEDKIIQRKLNLPEGEGYLLLYFDVILYDDISITNHPGRPKLGLHSFYQRLIKKQGEKGIIKVDLNFDSKDYENDPCKNIWIDYE
jgi:phospholipid N-methyltransferase